MTKQSQPKNHAEFIPTDVGTRDDKRMSQPQPIPVNARPEDFQGRYANAVAVTSQEREVVLDFMSHVNAGGQPQAALVSRVFLNHFTARELVELIQKTLAEWEKKRYELPRNNV